METELDTNSGTERRQKTCGVQEKLQVTLDSVKNDEAREKKTSYSEGLKLRVR